MEIATLMFKTPAWTVNIEEGRVDIHVEHPAEVKWSFPHCERKLSCYDHSGERP